MQPIVVQQKRLYLLKVRFHLGLIFNPEVCSGIFKRKLATFVLQLHFSCTFNESALYLRMSKIEKLIAKLLNRGSTITFKELEYMIEKLGYNEKRTGKTS
ncbi:MAG: hypothetical protein KJO50_06240, partial [Bacteroidia bacterium]|nr:hypothetical protein [Bacteroidia bacterium]